MLPVNTKKIGCLSLSSACEQSRFSRGLSTLKELGFEVWSPYDSTLYYGKHDHLFSAESREVRLAAFHACLEDPQIGAILAARGGYGIVDLLTGFDLETIRACRKPLIGFSDFTALLLLASDLGAPAMHGPSLESAFAKAKEDPEARQSAKSLVDFLSGANNQPLQNCALRQIGRKSKSEPVTIKGKVIGGNLSVLTSLIGTPWFPRLSGRILFLEEVGERPYRIHRMLTQLKLSGKLKTVRAVLLGSFERCQAENGPGLEEVLCDVFSDLEIPILGYLPCGHSALNLPLLFGQQAEISEHGLRYLWAVRQY